jgi:hypothetical protein
VPLYAPLALDNPFGAPSELPHSYVPAESDSSNALSYFRKLERDDLQFSSFIASRAEQDAADYRFYLGMGYKHELTSFARLSGRTYYGAGTYDGVNPEGAVLPDEVRASGNPDGAWLGSNWQIESKLFDRHTFFAGMEYRQQVAMPLMEVSEFLARANDLGFDEPTRKVGFVVRSRFALTSNLSLNLRTRLDESGTTAGLSTRSLLGGTNNFEVRMEHSDADGGRAHLSYAWQSSPDALTGDTSARVGQHLTKLRVEIPGLSKRLSTGFELQHLGVVGAFEDGQDREYFIGNLNLASHDISNRTRVSVGLNNLFGAKEVVSGTRLLSFIPPDGRSVRVDLVRKL